MHLILSIVGRSNPVCAMVRLTGVGWDGCSPSILEPRKVFPVTNFVEPGLALDPQALDRGVCRFRLNFALRNVSRTWKQPAYISPRCSV
jgi:hypothetical protein